MKLQRRQLLRASACLPLAVAAAPLSLTEQGQYRYLEVHSGHLAPLLEKGDFIIADQDTREFQGDGLYLYPAWGKPAVYAVKQAMDRTLVFSYPGQENALWRMPSTGTDSLFAGRAVAWVSRNDHAQVDLLHGYFNPLRVPVLPSFT